MPREARNGFIRHEILVPFAMASGTSAEEFLTDMVMGYEGYLEAADMIASVAAGAGAGASRPVSVVRTRGSTDVDMATLTAVLADLNAKGKVKGFTLSATKEYLRFIDGDKLSVAVAGSGTQFTALSGVVRLVVREKPQQLGSN